MKTRECKSRDGNWKLADGKWQGRAGTWLPAGGSSASQSARRGLRALPLRLCVSAVIWLVGLSVSHAQSYAIDWYKVAGGGGTSTGGTYQVSGTIGQPDASGAMTGGNYSLTGGFWALISVVQTPGTPNLIISHSGNSVIVSWPDPNTNSYSLLQNGNLSNTNGWGTTVYSITWANGTNSITINPPVGNLFFRLKNPNP